MNYLIRSIGHAVTPYQDKFAIPRQANLLTKVFCKVILNKNIPKESVRDLDQFSHIWLFSIFNKNFASNSYSDEYFISDLNHDEKPSRDNYTVRPPRLGGNKRVGVFASRSPFRPNFIGQSLVSLHNITIENQCVVLEIGNVDLVNLTPIIDIKPYLSYSDSVIGNISNGYAKNKPTIVNVVWSDNAKDWFDSLDSYSNEQISYFCNAIEEILSYDPRPAYKKNKYDEKQYVAELFDFEVTFTVNSDILTICCVNILVN